MAVRVMRSMYANAGDGPLHPKNVVPWTFSNFHTTEISDANCDSDIWNVDEMFRISAKSHNQSPRETTGCDIKTYIICPSFFSFFCCCCLFFRWEILCFNLFWRTRILTNGHTSWHYRNCSQREDRHFIFSKMCMFYVYVFIFMSKVLSNNYDAWILPSVKILNLFPFVLFYFLFLGFLFIYFFENTKKSPTYY